MAQKINLDSLNIDQLNLYKDKAVTMRNAGMILTLGGVGLYAIASIGPYILGNSPWNNAIRPAWTVGFFSVVVGIPLWAVGGSRNAKAELKLQKFNIVAENSMALGLGITIRF